MILSQFFSRHRAKLLMIVVLLASSAAISMALLSRINDLAASAISGNSFRPLIDVAILIAALLLVSGSSQVQLARLGAEFVAQLRVELSQRFVDMDYETLVNRKPLVFGALVEDIGRIAPLVLLAPQLVYNSLLAGLCSVYLCAISAPLFGILLFILSPTVAVSLALERATRQQFKEMRRVEETVFEYFRSINEGKKELSLNAARARHFTQELLHPAIRQAERLTFKVHLRWGLYGAWSGVAVYGAVFAVVYLGHVKLSLPLNVIVHFMVGGLFLIGPINFLILARQQVSAGIASLRHLELVGLDLPKKIDPHVSPSVTTEDLAPEWHDICVKDLCYRYPTDAGLNLGPGPGYGIGPVNLEIRRGEIVFLVGDNGSGKSTLLFLLCGLLRPTSGQVLIDGRVVQGELASYQSRLCGVFSDFFLFSHVLDASGRCLPDRDVDDLLRKLELSPQVGVEQGVLSRLNMSTGQRRRLALLQSYAEDREIYFFDEWAADQDAQFRQHFYCVFLPELKRRGKTVLVISHDDRNFHVADRIVRLGSGLVVPHAHTCIDVVSKITNHA